MKKGYTLYLPPIHQSNQDSTLVPYGYIASGTIMAPNTPRVIRPRSCPTQTRPLYPNLFL